MVCFPEQAAQAVKALVIGDVMLDRYWFGEVERISPEAPVPVVRVARREDRLGGAANVARNIAALGAQVSLFGLVGNDEPGQRVASLLNESQVISQVLIDPVFPTTLKMRVLGRQQQLLRVDFEDLPGQAALDTLYNNIIAAMPHHDIVVISDYAKGILSDVPRLITAARQQNIEILVDPKGHDYSRYRGASLMTPNRAEMRDAIGPWESDIGLFERAQALREQLQLQALLLTRSEEGMSLFTENQAQHVSADTHEVFDVSGAGDTVLATLAVARAAGLAWYDAMVLANRAGGVVVGKLGTSVVTPGELS